MNATTHPGLTAEDLMRMGQGAQVTALIRTGTELGVFERLAPGPADAAAVAQLIGADARGTRILLDALAAIGLVERAGERYALAPVAALHLVPGGPAYMGDMLRIFSSDVMLEGMKNLAAAVKHGGTRHDAHAETPDHPFWTDFARWSLAMAAPGGEAVAKAIAPWATGREPLRVLDVAAGSGFYGFGVAKAFPQARLTSLDWPNVLEVTRAHAEQAGLADRVRFLPGDAFTADLEGPYDLVVMSHIFHHFDEARCQQLLDHVAASVAPGGKVVINDFVAVGQDPAKEPFPYLFSVTMLTWTRQGEAFPLPVYARMLEKAGFAAPHVHDMPGMPSRLLVAEKR